MEAHQYTPIELTIVPDEEVEDPRVLDLVKEYQGELERGRRPDRARFLARHPDVAAVVARYLDGLDLLHLGAKGFPGGPRPASRLDTGLAPGDRVGEFEIVREVGRGGMGVVYEAEQPSLKRRVALKVLPAAFAADQKRIRRFTVEAQAAAAAAHPHIVPVYGVGEDRGVCYYVMRLVDGSPLDALATEASTRPIRRPPGRPAPPPADTPTDRLVGLSCVDRPAFHREIARLGATVARALDHAHQLGIVHRDVKPGNLLLGSDGHVWVTDFGLAQYADGPSVTRTGGPVGTLRYMSPEQASGDRRRLDHRTDVYSLAATLYELLTGRPVFPAEEPLDLLRQIADEDPPAPTAVDPTIPADLETVLLKALQKDPRDRYATAAEFADDLDRFLAGRPVRARRPSVWDRAKKWAGRHPTTVAAGLASLLAMAVGSGVTAALVAAEHADARRAYQAERDRADEAERRFRQAKALSDSVLRISEEEIGSNARYQKARRRLLHTALEHYQTLQAAGHEDPAVRAELARELARVENLLAEQDAKREAERTIWLGNPAVRADLHLSADQAKQVEGLIGQRGSDGHPPWMGWDQGTREALNRVLTPTQRQRLKQLDLQFQGPMAFDDPDVVEGLNLTASQREQIRMIRADVYAPGGTPRPGPMGDYPAVGPALSARLVRQILDTLTPEQRTAWRALTGRRLGTSR